MKKFILLFLLCISTLASASDTVTVYEVNAASQTGRPISHGRVFAKGEIANCPRPYVGGVALTTSNYQSDVKNRWPDGSVKFAIESYQNLAGLTSNGNVVITFQNDASCNNSGFLTQSQMGTFNSSNWGAQFVVTPLGGAAVTTSAATMLAASDPASNTFDDCKNDYWQQGPVVTTVIVQDCTSASIYDFGSTWNGTAMVTPVTGNDSHASTHPMFVLHFYPATNVVEVEFILEIPWTTRVQNQSIGIVLKTGGTPTQVYSKANFLMYAGQSFHWTFWSGTASKPIRIDHNFAYLKSTFAFPNYDPNVSVTTATDDAGNGATSYATWAASDKGDKGGMGGIYSWTPDYADDDEGAPLQREDLLYLYNMGTCGTVNSECAKAWAMLTGEVDSNPSNTIVGCSGGCGAWNNLGNVPFHNREGRTTAGGNISSGNSFYCPSLDSKDAAVNASSCGVGTGTATGKVISRHAHSTDQFSGALYNTFATVGDATSSSWHIGGCNHWLDYSYAAYLLTGSYYFLQNAYHSASVCIESENPDPLTQYGSAKFFGFPNHGGNTIRETGWGLQTISRAAFVAPDGTPEASYFTSMVNSTLEIEEGILGDVGTPLTPSDTSCASATCTFDPTTANRWNWGRAMVGSSCINAGTCTTITNHLHAVAQGYCDTVGQGAFLNYAVTDSYSQYWHYNWMNIAVSEAQELGFTNAAKLRSEMHQSLEEQFLDSTFNPYLTAAFDQPVRDIANAAGCNGQGYSSNQYIATYARLLTAYKTHAGSASLPGQATFDGFSSSPFYSGNPDYSNAACGSHSYSIAARAAASFLQYFGTLSTDANCPGGVCTAAAAWTFANAEIPYFNNTLSHNGGSAVSTKCAGAPNNVTDQQIKFALSPRAQAPASLTRIIGHKVVHTF